MAFEEDKRKKTKEKDQRKKAIIQDILQEFMKNNQVYMSQCVKPNDFKKRLRGRRGSDSLVTESSSLYFDEIKDKRRINSRTRMPRYYHLIKS
jgi:hypothetical protein